MMKIRYDKCPKILYTELSDKMAYANNVDPDQTAPDQGLHCLPLHCFKETTAKKLNLGKKVWNKVSKF